MRTLYSSQYEVDLTQLPLFKGTPPSLPGEFIKRAPNTTPSRAWTDTPKGQLPAPEVCIICLEELETDSVHRQLPCKHLFHQPFIDDWVCNRNKVPSLPQVFSWIAPAAGKAYFAQCPFISRENVRKLTWKRSSAGKVKFSERVVREEIHGQSDAVAFPPKRE